MSVTSGTQKHSISIPPEISKAVRDRAGARGFSAYVTEAVSHQLRRDALADVLDDMESEHGPVDESDVAQFLARLAP